MFKNVASQNVTVYAIDTATGLPKTGDASNITLYYNGDNGGVTVYSTGSGHPSEDDATNSKGTYTIAATQGETNYNRIVVSGKSSTSGIVIVPREIVTCPNRFSTAVIDSAGLIDANTVKVGPTGSGVAQTARDIGASVLLSSGTGTGQLDFTSGVVKANATQWLGGTIPAVTTTGVPLVDTKYVTGTLQTAKDLGAINVTNLNTLSGHDPGATLGTSTLTQTQVTGGAYSVQSASCVLGDARIAHLDGDISTVLSRIGSPAVSLTSALASLQTDTDDIQTRLPTALTSNGNMKSSLQEILSTALTETSGQLAGGFKKFFNIATPASTMDALTLVATATNLTNAPTSGDFTSTMKTSIGTAVAASAVASVTGAVGSVASGGISRASFAADTGLVSIRSNTAQAGASTTITLDASASSSNSFYVNCLILLTGGTGAGQSRFITAYNGTSKVATVAAWTTNPDNTTTFAILPFDSVPGATAPTAAAIADEVQTRTIAAVTTVASVTGLTASNLDAAVSSRMATFSLPTNFSSLGINGSGHISRVTLADTVTTLTNAPSDSSGISTLLSRLGVPSVSLTADIASVQADTDDLQTSMTTVLGRLTSTRAGYLDNLSAGAVATAASIAALNNLSAAQVWANGTRTLSDKTGFKLASDGLNLVIPADPGTTKPTFGVSSLVEWNAFFAAWSQNPADADSGAVTLYNSAGTNPLATYAISDDGTTFTEGVAT